MTNPTPMTREQAWETLKEARHDYAHGMDVQGYGTDSMLRLLADYDEAQRVLRTEMERLEDDNAELEHLFANAKAERSIHVARMGELQATVERLEGALGDCWGEAYLGSLQPDGPEPMPVSAWQARALNAVIDIARAALPDTEGEQ